MGRHGGWPPRGLNALAGGPSRRGGGPRLAAVGLLNRRLTSSRGRANSLYVLCYYIGGAVGITACGYAYGAYGWRGAIGLGLTVLLLPLTTGIIEIRGERR